MDVGKIEAAIQVTMRSNGTFENYTYGDAKCHEWDMLDMDLSIANALRRVILTDIPNLGFKGEGDDLSIEISHNDGPLHNEFIAHRIGMIPIHFTYAEHLEAAQDAEVSWSFELDASTASGEKRNVSTHDFKVFKNGAPLPHTETVRLFPADELTHDAILITRLRENERLALTAKPVRSTAREHAGFAPVSMCTYQFIVDPDAAQKLAQPLDKERAYFKNARGDPTRIHFAIETESALTPKQLVHMAFDVLLEKLERTKNILSGNADGEGFLVARFAQNGTKGFEFVFNNEDDTLGNLLQSLIYNETLRKREQQPPVVSYVGYFCPHPLDPTMVVRLVIDGEDVPTETYTGVFLTHVTRIEGIMAGLKAAWEDFAPR